MDLEKLHERGERVTVFWPGGPYDFVLEWHSAESCHIEGWDEWLVISGLCVRPVGVKHRSLRQFYVKPVEGGYELLPMRKG